MRIRFRSLCLCIQLCWTKIFFCFFCPLLGCPGLLPWYIFCTALSFCVRLLWVVVDAYRQYRNAVDLQCWLLLVATLDVTKVVVNIPLRTSLEVEPDDLCTLAAALCTAPSLFWPAICENVPSAGDSWVFFFLENEVQRVRKVRKISRPRCFRLPAEKTVEVMTGIRRKLFKQALLDASSSHQIGSRELLRASRWGFMVILAVNQGMKVAMKARTRQQEFSWTTCLAMLGKNWSR